MVIKLEPEEGGAFNFKPGQYCTLGLGSIERAYSIASAPHEKTLEVFVELVPDGELTPLMWRLRPGRRHVHSVPGPRASSPWTKRPHHHFMLSTVTGVSPSVSMVRDYLHNHPEPVAGDEGHTFYILLGASYP